MIRLVLAAGLLAGCRISLENQDLNRTCTVGTSPQCMEAANHSDLPWIEQNIFAASCNFSGCHDTATDQGRLDLRPGVSHNSMVGVSSLLDPTRQLVVPNDVAASYLMLMLDFFPPSMASPPGTLPSVGTMPQGSPILCCQKLDAVERWINGGAQTN